MAMGMLGTDQSAALAMVHNEAESPEDLDGPIPRVASGFSRPIDKRKFAKSLLKDANDQFRNGIRPIDLLPADDAQDSFAWRIW